MRIDDLEKELRDAKFHHLTEDELDSYHDQKLDAINRARADAHLKLCLLCYRHLALIKAESAALDNRESTAEDVALARRVMQKKGFDKRPSASKPGEAVTLPDRLADYLGQIVESWRAHFLQLTPVRETVDPGEEIWRWQSKDGILKARVVLEKNRDLTIHFFANDLSLEGVQLEIHLGAARRKIILQRVSDTEVYAEMKVLLRELPRKLADLTIELI